MRDSFDPLLLELYRVAQGYHQAGSDYHAAEAYRREGEMERKLVRLRAIKGAVNVTQANLRP